MEPLQQLIQDFLDRTGENYSDIARRGDLHKQTVRRFHVQPLHRAPKRDNIVKLAVGIQQPLHVVLAAAGFPPEADLDPAGRIFAMLYADLDEDDQAEIRRRIDFLREERRRRRGGS